MTYARNRGLDFIFKYSVKRSIFCPKPHGLLCLVYIIECMENTYLEWKAQLTPFLIDSYYISNEETFLQVWNVCRLNLQGKQKEDPAHLKSFQSQTWRELRDSDCRDHTVSSVKADSTYLQYLLVATEHRGGICVFIESCRCLTIICLAYPEFLCENPGLRSESTRTQKWSQGRARAPPQMFHLSFPLLLVL